MDLTADDYAIQLRALLPPGPAWDGVEDLLSGFAQELARIDGRAWTLIGEIDPSTTTELLAEWEQVAGLPESCSADVVLTVPQRRAALVIKLTHTGGASRQFFIDLSASAGYTITIEEFYQFRVGMAVGNPLNGDGWAYAWRINSAAVTVTAFATGKNRVGQPLRSWADPRLECLINTHKPAHTVTIFAYH
jgi:uncharacterized protein YmfQ (DUF2313 family)